MTISPVSQSHWSKHFALAAAVAAVGLFAPGCQDKPAQVNRQRAEDSQLALRDGAVQQPVEQPPSNALANKINSYTEQLAQQLAQRQQKAGTGGPGGQAGDPSQVQFMNPAGTGPTTLPVKRGPDPKVVDLANPVVDAQPSSGNAQMALALAPGQVQPSPTLTQGAMRISQDDLNRTVVAAKPALPGADMELKFARHIQDYPRDLWAHLDFQLLHFLRDEQTPQLDALTALPLEDRELIATVMDGMTNFRNTLRADSNTQLSKKIRPLLELADRLRSQADLNIPVATLCTKVDAFGVYEPIDPMRFVAGKEHQAIVYCEIENFASTPLADKKMWETKLKQEAVLYTESGMPVWVDKAGDITDHSRNRRHDFFVVKKIMLPAQLTIGRYLLKVTVEDEQVKRVAEQTISLEIVAQLEAPARSDVQPVVGK